LSGPQVRPVVRDRPLRQVVERERGIPAPEKLPGGLRRCLRRAIRGAVLYHGFVTFVALPASQTNRVTCPAPLAGGAVALSGSDPVLLGKFTTRRLGRLGPGGRGSKRA